MEEKMMINITESNVQISDELKLYHKGFEQCSKGYSFGPFVRDHYLVHFILKGQGTFKVLNKSFPLTKNQAFFIFPDRITYYQADINDPWTYCWLGFHGKSVKDLLKETAITPENPILNFNEDGSLIELVKKAVHLDDKFIGNSLKSKGLLYLLLDEIQNASKNETISPDNVQHKKNYIDKAIDYIQRNYSMEIKIEDIVNYVDLNRSYFCRIFKEVMKVSPQQYLIHFRIKKAVDLLKNTNLSIASVGLSVGYYNPYHFSKIFKQTTGVSPKQYRI
jgi:AraC-like DNA-binding protein